MDPATLIELGLPGAVWTLLAGSLGVVVALVCGALLTQGWRVPTAAVAACVGLPALVVALSTWAAVAGVDVADPQAVQGVVAVAVVKRLLAVGAVGAPGLLLLLLAAAAGFLGQERRLGPAALAAGGGLLAGACILGAGLSSGEPVLTTFRALCWGGLGVLVAVAFSGCLAEEPSRREAAGAAAVALPVVVAAGEVSARGVAELIAVNGMTAWRPEIRLEIAESFAAEVFATQAPWVWAAVGAACLPLLVHTALRLRQGEVGALGGLLALPLVGLLLTVGQPSPLLLAGGEQPLGHEQAEEAPEAPVLPDPAGGEPAADPQIVPPG